MRRGLACLFAFCFVLAVFPLAAPRGTSAAVSVPSGFRDALYASGFDGRLTTMTWGPGGRLFVSEKQGKVRIVKDGALLDEAFLSVNAATDSEKGLKGIAFDPGYATNGFVYVYYTDATTLKNKVSRFTVSSNPNKVDQGTERVLLNGIDSGVFHSGGALHFGPDGKLYISTGDASSSRNGQLLDTLNGKILRINADGSIPDGNPFKGQSGKRGEIWAYGLRNPYTFAFDPGSSRMYINDVGNTKWEEIDAGRAGANYGWPTCEGVCGDSRFVDPIYAYSHDADPGKSITGAVFYRGSMFPSAFVGRFFFGDYVGNYIRTYDPATQQVAGFATNAMNPVDLDVGPDGALYYLSVEEKEIHRIAYGSGPGPTPTPDPSGNLLRNGGFEASSGFPSPWAIKLRSPGEATVIRDTSTKMSGNASAKVNVTAADLDWYVQLNQPNVDLTAGRVHTLTFAARASSARAFKVTFQDGQAPYTKYTQQFFSLTSGWATYSWQFTPGVDDADVLMSTNLGNAVGQVWLDDFRFTTGTSAADLPIPVIDTPSAGTKFRATDEISFSGHASDPQDGGLEPADLTWEVVFHHDTHTHPFVEPFSGESGGSFVASDTGETSPNIWYRIHLTATDSDGNTAEVTRDVRPVTANVTLATQPAGLRLNLDGSEVTTPYSLLGVVRFKREISAPATQTVDGVTYRFVSWSDGGAATHTIATPGSATTFTATYTADEPAPAFGNPGFERTGTTWLSPWEVKVRSPAAAGKARDTNNPQQGSASLRVNVQAASEDWHVQLVQSDVPLVAGVPHTFSFWARSSSASRVVGVAFHRNTAPYPVYFERRFNVGTAWARYQVTFPPTADDASSLFVFNIGQRVGQVWFDSVSLTR